MNIDQWKDSFGFDLIFAPVFILALCLNDTALMCLWCFWPTIFSGASIYDIPNTRMCHKIHFSLNIHIQVHLLTILLNVMFDIHAHFLPIAVGVILFSHVQCSKLMKKSTQAYCLSLYSFVDIFMNKCLGWWAKCGTLVCSSTYSWHTLTFFHYKVCIFCMFNQSVSHRSLLSPSKIIAKISDDLTPSVILDRNQQHKSNVGKTIDDRFAIGDILNISIFFKSSSFVFISDVCTWINDLFLNLNNGSNSVCYLQVMSTLVVLFHQYLSKYHKYIVSIVVKRMSHDAIFALFICSLAFLLFYRLGHLTVFCSEPKLV